MRARSTLPAPLRALRQRGQAMIFVAVLLLLGISALIYGMTSSTSVSIANRQADNTARTLAEVKQALIGWSAARDPAADGTNARPGELPCPDINPLDGYEDGSCVAGALGRVPWRTLGIPEPKDEAGETLWYTVADKFRIKNLSGDPITSDTLGNITVYDGSTSTKLTEQAIAVIFAPGAALGTQDRSTTTTMTCTAPSGIYPRNVCASNYLETLSAVNNATINGLFIRGPSSSTFNDRLLVITTTDLMPLVEQRVAREMMSLLERYRLYRVVVNGGGSGDYPSADISNGSSDDEYNRHRFPCANAIPTPWTSAGIQLPDWLTNGCGSNGWASVIFYAVAKNRLESNNCSTCDSSTTTCPGTSTTSSTTRLTVTNADSRVADLCPPGASPFTCTPTVLTNGIADLILITPGAFTPATVPSSRASGWPFSLSPITGYFEDSSNSDNDNYNCFVVPTLTSSNRDRIYVVR